MTIGRRLSKLGARRHAGRLAQIFGRLVLATLVVAACTASPSQAVEKAEAAQGPPLNVAVLVSSGTDGCYDPGTAAAIERLTLREQSRINARGGAARRPVHVKILDDARDPQKLIANMRAALADPQLLAIIGVSSSTRAKAAFDALGGEIDKHAIPFLSDVSVNSIFEGHPTVFTTRPSQDDERLPVIEAFTKSLGFLRPAFVGLADVVYSTSLGDGLKAHYADGLVADHRLRTEDNKIIDGQIGPMIANLEAQGPDLLHLVVGSANAGAVIKALIDAGVTPALFLTGRIESLPPEIAAAYPNAIYQLAWDRLPELFNDRLRKVIAIAPPEEWVFQGPKNDAAPGWKTGECTPRDPDAAPDPLESVNMRAIALGAQYADMLGLVAEAAGKAQPRTDIAVLRSRIVEKLKTAYAAGRGAFKGSFENWSFDPSVRGATKSPFIIILPHGLGRMQLAPVQFVRTRSGGLRRTTTLYADVDLIKAHRVDDNEKAFFAEFYLSIRDNPTIDIDKIEFANAYLDPASNSRQLTIETVHGGGDSETYPNSMRIYKISGRFLFDPRLDTYPFDTQRFSIDLQPKSGDTPFIVQPPPLELRDKRVVTDGWDPRSQYVGYEEDFIPVIDAYTHVPSVVPFYKASFVWMMKRQTTDYFLRVVVPLIFILVVAYWSIFIPGTHFEAIVTIQVTALLSAVALYLSLPKLDSDTATLSDRLFVLDYMLVSVMIVISILRVNRLVARRPGLTRALDAVHIIAIPIIVVVAAFYVYGLSMADR